jgi:hypothetical protein
VVVLGIIIADALNRIDKQYDLSNKIIDCIRKGLKEQQKIAEWNAHNSVYDSSFYWGVTDMDVTINLVNLKKRFFLLLVIAFYCGFAWLAYFVSMQSIIDLVESRSIVYYFWGCFIGMLFIPALCYFAFVFVFVFLRETFRHLNSWRKELPLHIIISVWRSSLALYSHLLSYFIHLEPTMSYVNVQDHFQVRITPGPRRFARR